MSSSTLNHRMKPYAIVLISFFISLLFVSLFPPRFLPQSKMSESQKTQSQPEPQPKPEPIDAYDRLHITRLDANGTITRFSEFFPTVAPSNDGVSLSKDVPLNPDTHTWIRLFLPRQALNGSGSDPSKKKLPIVVFVHGGGFILGSAAQPEYHEFCSNAASRLGALIVSVEYRLAPENRLPAAYDDVLEALTWVRDSKDEWVQRFGDLSRCVMMGDSAGGNIVYHSGLRVAGRVDEFKPLVVRGLVLIQPYFGGVDPTGSEIRLKHDSVLPSDVNEIMWELSLPVGANRSHEYSDPTLGGGSELIYRVRDLEWRVGVVASGGDPLFDRDVELARLLERKGLVMKCLITKDDQHGMFVSDDTNKRKDLLDFVMDILSPLVYGEM